MVALSHCSRSEEATLWWFTVYIIHRHYYGVDFNVCWFVGMLPEPRAEELFIKAVSVCVSHISTAILERAHGNYTWCVHPTAASRDSRRIYPTQTLILSSVLFSLNMQNKWREVRINSHTRLKMTELAPSRLMTFDEKSLSYYFFFLFKNCFLHIFNFRVFCNIFWFACVHLLWLHSSNPSTSL